MIPSAPFWSHVALTDYPPIHGGTQRVDVAVVGGGLAGLSSAYHLLRRRPGIRLIVLEANRVGAGASGRTTGLLGPGVGQNLTALARQIGESQAQKLYRETLRAVEDVCALVEAERIECELQMSGHVIVARGPGGRQRLTALAQLFRRLDLPGDVLDDQALSRVIRLAPDPRRRAGKGPAAMRLPRAGTLHPVKLLAGLAERVTALGGVIHERTRVMGLGVERPVRIEVQGGEVLADEVILATAGYTPDLGLFRGRLLPVHLQAVVTEPLDERAFDRIGWAGREGIRDSRRVFSYFRLTADNRVVFGGGLPRYRWGGRTDEGGNIGQAIGMVETELKRTFPAAARLHVAGGWSGVIGYTLDGLPAIARMERNPSVVHAVGWCGHGVALAVAAGDWVTKILCDRAVPEDLPWYRRYPPLVPGEAIRWVGFRVAVRLMKLLDQLF